MRNGILSAVAAFAAACAPDSGERLAEIARLETAGDPASIAEVETRASDGEAAVRAMAIATLARLDPERAYAVALRGLDDDAATVRAASARALGVAKELGAVAALARVARRDLSWEVRRGAAEALGALRGDEAAKALREVMLDPEEAVRIVAVRALAEIDPAGSVRACLFVMRTDESWQVRWEAARLLGLARTGEAREGLREASASDPNEFVRAQAARVLGP